MKKVQILLLAGLVISLLSCSKNDDGTNSDTHFVQLEAGYIPFYPGNYWVYEHYQIDTLGNETLLTTYDSVIITGITTVNTSPYLTFEGTWPSNDTVLLLADSVGYFVDPTGYIHFATDNFTDTLGTFDLIANGDTLFESWYKMQSDVQTITVPAGTFETLNYRGTIRTHNPPSYIPEIRYKDQQYANNVGMVLDTYYYLNSPMRFERRLKRYFIDDRSWIY